MASLRDQLRARLKSGMNRIQKEVDSFETRGGWRGAVERAKVRSERKARDLVDALEQRGVRVNFTRLLPPSDDERAQLRAHYALLEVPCDADLETVKTAYRAKMRQFHPDRHANDPDREREATEIAQRLSVAYAAIEVHLKARG